MFAYIGIAIGFGSWGYSAIAPEPNIYFGLFLMVVGAIFLAKATGERFRWNRRATLIATVAFSIPAVVGAAYLYRPPFRIETGLTFINLSQRLEDTNPGSFWVTYRSSYGDTASPSALTQYVDITNLRPTSETIESFSEAIQTEQCGWIELVPIYIKGTNVWFTYEGLRSARLMDFTPNGLDYRLGNAIGPNETVSGIWFFDSKKQCDVPKDSWIRYRINLTTHSGVTVQHTSNWERADGGHPTGNEGRARGPQFVIPPGKPQMDISGFHKKLYSAPVQ